MTTLSTFSRLATVAVAALLLAPIHNAQAKGGGRMAFGAVTTGTNQPGPSPVVSTRDHRGGATTPRRADTRPTATAPPSFVTIAGIRCRGRCRPTGTGTEARRQPQGALTRNARNAPSPPRRALKGRDGLRPNVTLYRLPTTRGE